MSEEQKVPSKEEVIAFLQEQIEVKKVQVELQELNMKLALARAEELKALNFIAQITNPNTEGPKGRPHTVTQEDLDNNPELKEAGVSVGDEVLIGDPGDDGEELTSKQRKSRGLKK